MNKLLITAATAVVVVAGVTVAHKKGWLPASVSDKISKAAAATKGVFTKKDVADVVTPEKGDTSHAKAPAAEEVKPEAATATPAPEAANAAAPEAGAQAA